MGVVTRSERRIMGLPAIVRGPTMLAVISLISISRATLPCIHNDVDPDGNDIKYDLRPLVSTTTYVFKARVGSFHYRYHGQQYDYLVNVCEDVHPDAKHASCDELAHSPAYQVTAPPAPVPVYNKAPGKYVPPPPPPYRPACFRLADSGSTKFELLNTSNPEEGIKVVYRGGQRCRKRNTPEVIKKTNETWKDVDREVELHLFCDREMGKDPASAMTDLINSGATILVEEKPPPHECQYVVRWRTQHACPQGSGYAPITSLAYTGVSAGGSDSWGWLFFKWASIAFTLILVFLLLLCYTAVTKRIAQYRRGEFNSFGEFTSMLMGDIHVKIQTLMSGNMGSGLPTQHKRMHMHEP